MLTVLIATHNGAYTLPRVVAAYRRIDPPAGGWRMVVVDNGSTDATRAILATQADGLPLTCICEPRRGQNRARNAGLAHVEGDLVVMTDDDVLPRPDWLQRLRRAADAHPEFAILGGPIVPEWEYEPADWILSWVPLSSTFAVSPPLAEGPIVPRKAFSPNLAIRTEVFRRGYRFDETIGPAGGEYAMGSETELLVRLADAGFRAWHCADAVVQHLIRGFQMDEAWILARAIRFGRGHYRLVARGERAEPRRLFGLPRYLVWRTALQGIKVAGTRLAGNRERAFKARWHWNFLRGQLLEARGMNGAHAITATQSDDGRARSEAVERMDGARAALAARHPMKGVHVD